LVVNTALTVSLVPDPVTVNPFPTVRCLIKVADPDKVLTVNVTVTLATPAGEAAVKESVLDG